MDIRIQVDMRGLEDGAFGTRVYDNYNLMVYNPSESDDLQVTLSHTGWGCYGIMGISPEIFCVKIPKCTRGLMIARAYHDSDLPEWRESAPYYGIRTFNDDGILDITIIDVPGLLGDDEFLETVA